MKGIVDNYYVLVNFHKTRLRMPFDLSWVNQFCVGIYA
jgi:hypothetical protein